MLSPLTPASRLVTGARLSLDEFIREWDAQPDIKHAELIDGVVYMPSPVSREHSRYHVSVVSWLWRYAQMTPGCECGDNATWYMLGSAPQPDAFLRILPAHGGQSGEDRNCYGGAPELSVEVCMTSTEVDFGPKLALYQRAGVQEYVTIELLLRRITWRVLDSGSYKQMHPDADGILKSRRFPGLWLDIEAFWADDGKRLMSTADAGLATGEHRQFAASLASRP